MLEVCFGDSEKGSMRVAQKEMKLLGKKSREIVSFFGLDIFDIKSGINGQSRRNQIFKMFKGYGEDEEELNKWLNRGVEDLNQLIYSAKKGEDIRIWYSDAPSSTCGLYFVMSQLKDFECKITTIKLPKLIENINNEVEESLGWGAIKPENFGEFFQLEKEITKSEIKYMAMVWEKLKEENAALRVIINGKLTSAPLDFYDYYIRKEIPDKEFIMGRAIGKVLGKYGFGIGDLWVTMRMEEMISRGELEIVKDDEIKYKSILKKTKNF